MKQRTIVNPCTLEGVGLHTGANVKLTFKPASENQGIKFVRTDKTPHVFIPADAMKVVSTARGTTIASDDTQIATVEHVLAALTGMGIDNINIEVDGPEMPIMDGSSRFFVDAIKKVGIKELEADKVFFEIKEPIIYKNDERGSELIALPNNHYELTSLIDFNSDVVGHQFAALENIEKFETEIAPCRTFVFLHEIEKLFDQNLIKGGDVENAIIIVDRVMNQEELDSLAAKLGKTSVKVEKTGILNTMALHFENEPARHKLLDVIGDLTLVGMPIKGKIVAKKPGHSCNVEFAKLLKKAAMEQKQLKERPQYDPDKEPVMDTFGIMKKLPHRYPFLMVDKVIEMDKDSIVAVKHVTSNEYYFEGHFPDNPVMPGVLQIEAMAQTGGILALANTPDEEVWDTYFLKIDNAKFKAKVLPGDTLIMKLELLEPIRRGIVKMKGTAFVGNKVVSEGEFTAQIVKRT